MSDGGSNPTHDLWENETEVYHNGKYLTEEITAGKLLLVDTRQGVVLGDSQVKERYARREPYGEWLSSSLVPLGELKIPNERVPSCTGQERARLQKAFGYTYEEYRGAHYVHGTEKSHSCPSFLIREWPSSKQKNHWK